ncbi:MAG: methylenetetrahydrofolate reductase [NAD(P)H] [Deltaproteobacteria bacterium]|nr:methylenetetrahydrofolate reductase [NAD(P)H] [Deltaproteobacteria bacterium]
MRIANFYRPAISFEFFPPKTEGGYTSLKKAITDLKALNPSFVSVTWGAGGSTREKTRGLVTQIQDDIGIPAMAHLTCVGTTRDEMTEILDGFANAGITNVLALRGDPPQGQEVFEAVEDGFAHADDLVSFLRTRWNFCIGGACYPEGHAEAESLEEDLTHLKRKVDAGVDFLITQLFFDNQHFFRFVERARMADIHVPIVPGIMPALSAASLQRFRTMCGCDIPRELEEQLTQAGEDKVRAMNVGVDWATAQCRELLDHGIPGLHFYTLNQSLATQQICRNLFET